MNPTLPYGHVFRTAWISPDGRWRYDLSRRWATGGLLTFIMLNPSTADADVDDPTIRRCIGFARRENLSGIRVVNLCAHRTTRPIHLNEHSFGPDNAAAISAAAVAASITGTPVVAAWGANQFAKRFVPQVLELLGPTRLSCLGTTKDGSPCHPLYRPADQPIEPWPRLEGRS